MTAQKELRETLKESGLSRKNIVDVFLWISITPSKVVGPTGELQIIARQHQTYVLYSGFGPFLISGSPS